MSEKEIQTRVRDFNYGELSKGNKPSIVNFKKKNLGQNATQMHCLFIHIAFIFVDKSEILEDIWLVVSTLLRCVDICFSKSICEKEIKEFESLIDLHLKLFKENFKTRLRPKHHFLTHYPNAIRRMGRSYTIGWLGLKANTYFLQIWQK